MKFTKASVAAAAANSGDKDQIIWDDGMPGFGIRVRNGRGSFLAQFRIGGRGSQQRRVSLGDVRKVDLDETKKEASRMFTDAAKLVDPTAARAKAEIAASELFKDAIEDFISFQKNKGRSKSHVDQTINTLRVHCVKLHGLALANIERSLIAEVLKASNKTRGPVAADRSRAHLSKFFVWAIGDGLCHANPVDYSNTYSEEDDGESIGRELKPAELKAIWRAATETSDERYGNIVKLLMLTGKRRTEIGALRWSEVDLDAAVIRLPGGRAAARTKNRQADEVALSKPAVAILKNCQRIEGQEFVFGGVGIGGYKGWSKAKTELDAQLKITAWRHHDLRHTVETVLGEKFSVQPVHIDAVLNHITGEGKKGVRRVYNHAKYDDQKRAAMDLYGKYIMDCVGPTKPDLKLVA